MGSSETRPTPPDDTEALERGLGAVDIGSGSSTQLQEQKSYSTQDVVSRVQNHEQDIASRGSSELGDDRTDSVPTLSPDGGILPIADEAAEQDGGNKQKKKRKNHRGGKKNRRGKGQVEEKKDEAAQHMAGAHDDGASNKLYETKTSEEKGLGVFATQDIKRGTRIMCEKPLIHLSSGDISHVANDFSKLNQEEQTLFLSLHSRPLGDLDSKRAARLRSCPLALVQACGLTIDQQVNLMAIVDTNCFEAAETSVVCAQASRINHSCLPNVHHCWNQTLGAETIHATKDIGKGEELLTTYIKICRTHAQREKELDRYGFKCHCPACDGSNAFCRASEKRLKRLLDLDQSLAIHVQHPTLSKFRSDRQALNAVQETIKLLEEEGVNNMEMTRSYREAACFSAKLDDLKVACIWAEKALENTAVCAGKDYEGYETDQKTLQDLVSRRDAGGGARAR